MPATRLILIEGMLRFYEMRRDLEKNLFAHLPLPRKLWLGDAGLDWPATTQQVAEFLESSLGRRV